MTGMYLPDKKKNKLEFGSLILILILILSLSLSLSVSVSGAAPEHHGDDNDNIRGYRGHRTPTATLE